MNNHNFNKYSNRIKKEPEQYNYQRNISLQEENHSNNGNNNSNFRNNYNKMNNFNNNHNNPKKFLGIKREKQEEDRYSNNSNNSNNNKRYNQNNTNNYYNKNNNNYNNKYSNKIKKENVDKYSNYNPNSKNVSNYNYQKNNKRGNLNQEELPIYNVKDSIIQTIKENRVTIISGNTGCGKSTQVPQYIYGMNCNNRILMTQPRRIAAISIAKRLAQEMNEKLGGKIGYHVSMNPRIGSDTQIFVKTTGIFMEELIHANLERKKEKKEGQKYDLSHDSLDYTHIIIDEVHERDIYVDLVLALIKNYFEKHPNSKIKIILMSATIKEEIFINYLADCNKKEVPKVKIYENRHDVKEYGLMEIISNLKYDKYISDDLKKEIESVSQLCISQVKPVPVFMDELFPIVAGIIEKIENENPNSFSGVLIFVPGLGEIQELQSYLSRYFLNKTTLEFLILHSQISDDEQDLVFKKMHGKRKIILATNIAESSITISNIDFVIDFCLVKQTRFDEYQNTSILELKWCSKASVQQRMGRTGRTNKGYYFRLITKKLYDRLEDHPTPEILRTPLETPILKLKIYEPENEPQDILLKTIEPPEEEKIINTLFRLEKMGALIQGKYELNRNFIDKKIIDDDMNVEVTKKNYNNKYIYKSGIITKVGKIFAELPIDIKYSRLIMIAYALGEIDLGITLAAIISQDKSMFLSSDKCNRFNIYNAKDHFCFKQSCDFIACYTAYKKWYYKWGHYFVNQKVKFDTQLKPVESKQYEEIRKDTFAQALDIRVLKEIIKVENDLKKRLTKFKLYSQHFSSYKNPSETINFQKEEEAFILKVILAGTFYNQIFCPDYDDTRNIEEDILDISKAPDQEKESELKTIRITNISEEDGKKLIQIFSALIRPHQILSDDYDDACEIYKIQFNENEDVKKILFITSAAIRRGKDIPIFEYIKEGIITTNEANSLGTKNDNSVIIKLVKEPEYYYRVHYFDEYNRENVFPDKDSINLIQIIPNLEQLKLCKLVTDSYNNKSGNTLKKFARYTSLLPKEQNFDKLIMLIFAPKYKMVGYNKDEPNDKSNYKKNEEEYDEEDEVDDDKEEKKYLKYIGFRSYELTGLHGFDRVDYNNQEFRYNRAKFIKLDYLITNYHLSIINEIRVLINEMIKFKFISKKEEIDMEMFLNFEEEKEDSDIKEEEFKELFIEYKKKAKKICEKIRTILTEKKIRNISDKKYQELFEYIEQEKNPKKKEINIEQESPSDSEPEEEDSPKKDKIQIPDAIEYVGYRNQIANLQKKVQNDDFLQLHKPLKLEGESIYNNDTKVELNSREMKIKNLYNDFVENLRKKESLAFNSEAWLICAECFKEICPIKEGNPILTNQNVGEYKLLGPWLKQTLKPISNQNRKKENKKKEKKISKLYDENKKKIFEEKLKEKNIQFDDLITCPTRKHIIGYMRCEERLIYCESNLMIKYPDLTYEKIIAHDVFFNNFKNVHEKVKEIMEIKTTADFKSKIFCKLCEFYIKDDLNEFKEHLEDEIHKDKMKELRKEFI